MVRVTKNMMHLIFACFIGSLIERSLQHSTSPEGIFGFFLTFYLEFSLPRLFSQFHPTCTCLPCSSHQILSSD